MYTSKRLISDYKFLVCERMDFNMMASGGLFLRRCHVCGATIEKSIRGETFFCLKCGKHLAPFFYFDERQIIGFGDRVGISYRLGESKTTYIPLVGFGLFWERTEP